MGTQHSGGTPHTCKAVEHCHALNELVSDITAELATLRTLVRSLGEELGRYRKDSLQWHNALAQESRAHQSRIESLERAPLAGPRPHCPGFPIDDPGPLLHIIPEADASVVMALVDHQRHKPDKCLCGWGELGKSHAEHVAGIIRPLVEAEVRESVAREIEAERAKVDAEIERGVYRYGSAVEPGSVDPFLTERSDAYSASARIARGSNA